VAAAVLVASLGGPPPVSASAGPALRTEAARTQATSPARKRQERRRREAQRRAEERQRAEAIRRAWDASKGCHVAGTQFPEPRLLKAGPLEVPERARGGPLKAALLVYEVQLDKDGRVRQLRTLRPLPTEPPWPDLHEAAVQAARQWRYERTRLAGKSVPVCLPVSLNIDLRPATASR